MKLEYNISSFASNFSPGKGEQLYHELQEEINLVYRELQSVRRYYF